MSCAVKLLSHLRHRLAYIARYLCMPTGAGALILGNIRIGDGCKIAAGSVVLMSLPAHTTGKRSNVLTTNMPDYITCCSKQSSLHPHIVVVAEYSVRIVVCTCKAACIDQDSSVYFDNASKQHSYCSISTATCRFL
jgi:hypothetical protein